MISKKFLASEGSWYEQQLATYGGLVRIVKDTSDRLLRDAGVDFLTIDGRVKNIESYVAKVKRKGYKHPRTDTHDFAGVRVIVYTESEVQRTVGVLSAAFSVHPDKSLDKKTELGVDRTGYRSIHLVCDLGNERGLLPEYSAYGGLVFEVQVRTVLQHAWAEIEHDRNYKFAGGLPDELQRRLFVAAGALELVDREFDSLARDIDAYAEEVRVAMGSGELAIPLNSTSVAEYLETRFAAHSAFSETGLDREDSGTWLSELREFGVTSLDDLDKLMTPEFLAAHRLYESTTNLLGFMRSAMMYSDLERFLSQAFQNHWQVYDETELDLFGSKYGRRQVKDMFEKHGLLPDWDYDGDPEEGGHPD